jgi:hypothetical protein
MKIAILSSVAGVSSKILCTAFRNNGIESNVYRTAKTDKRDFSADYDVLFSYGCATRTTHKKRFNQASAVDTCISKPWSFEAFKRAQVDTVDYVKAKPIPAAWPWVVVRDNQNGRKAEGLSYHENGPDVPDGGLYTEYFEHRYEYRIMVWRYEVVGRYYKDEHDGDWYFNLQPKRGFEEMDRQCIRAAAALGIDYVGFDVVAASKDDFRILEANSGPRITDEAENAIVEYFINL